MTSDGYSCFGHHFNEIQDILGQLKNIDSSRVLVWRKASLREELRRKAVWIAEGFRLRQREEWHPNGRTVVFIDPSTSDVLTTHDALNEPVGTRAANTAYPLHAATIGRPWLSWLALLTTATAMLLIVYGATAWVRGSLNRQRPASSRER
ncbi:MAG TPA: hypothetical protein VFU31_17275 [Candidatus Binatia bacterium]|nr:hypothetical protein [Candidatus Binatia bacterium]